ncbi:FK506-binding protein 2-like [Stylophora pistillata]|uniref:FK506-binding protein 2-like n=1 Tax=Stylophora pistillata TaxID=50429 RepID=UPI000C05142A|nr:FK506-binding protein 2-like [Stylophora pistillata]
MENNFRLLFCSLFLFLLCQYAFGAKKKKDLETVFEYNPATCEDKAYDGDIVSVHYTGTLEKGQIFDSSLAKGRQPLEFQLGKGKVIKGWEMGIKGMCIGEKRKFIIPSHLGYGARGIQNVIPANSVLIFTTELMSIKRKSLFDPKLILQIGFWPVLAGVILYYLYRKACKESSKPETK